MTAVLFQSMPPLSPEEYAALEASIRQHGILVPITVDENGVVIDGHHRKAIAEALDIHCPRKHVYDLTETAKRTMALTLNLDRRNLTREQRRAIVEASVKADPQLSDREHARRTGVSDKTVGGIRADMVGRAEIPHVAERADSLGRMQPATKPQPPAPDDVFVAERIDPVTGEVVPPPMYRPTDVTDWTTEEIELQAEADEWERQAWLDATVERHHLADASNKVAGLDGKTYSRPVTKPGKLRPPLPDAIEKCVANLRKYTAQLDGLVADDRLPQNKDKVAARNHSDLIRIIDALHRAATTIGEPAE